MIIILLSHLYHTTYSNLTLCLHLSRCSPPLLRRHQIRCGRSTPLCPKESDVLSERHILAIRIPERLANLRAMQALDAPNLRGRVINHASPDFEGCGIVQFVCGRVLAVAC